MENIYWLYWFGVIIATLIIVYKSLQNDDKFNEGIKSSVDFFGRKFTYIIIVLALIFISLFSWLYVIHIINKKKDD